MAMGRQVPDILLIMLIDRSLHLRDIMCKCTTLTDLDVSDNALEDAGVRMVASGIFEGARSATAPANTGW